jgi:hypothetical protein
MKFVTETLPRLQAGNTIEKNEFKGHSFISRPLGAASYTLDISWQRAYERFVVS